jgi:hypothetical protein
MIAFPIVLENRTSVDFALKAINKLQRKGFTEE